MKLSNKAYDVLKFIAQILLPAMGTLYFALARIWNFPYAEEVVGTIAAVDTFLGAVLQISSSGYQGDGALFVNGTNEDGAPMQLNSDLLGDNGKIDLKGKKYLTLKVVE
jgi:hypothetical protein